MTHLEDSKIIDLFFTRSEQAIGELDKAHGAAVRKTAGNILWDRLDVEEIINDTLYRFLLAQAIRKTHIAASAMPSSCALRPA